eukprot:m.968662 g.968662  ORF g.968662 m.968662 type:complete len:498 (-) comp23918_c0_seq1:2325-3818(-)
MLHSQCLSVKKILPCPFRTTLTYHTHVSAEYFATFLGTTKAMSRLQTTISCAAVLAALAIQLGPCGAVVLTRVSEKKSTVKRVHVASHKAIEGQRFAPWSAISRRVLQDRHGVSDAVPTLPVGGDIWPIAIFWAYVDVGTPTQRFPVAIDSGSYTLDIPLTGCKGCVDSKPNNFYEPSKSSSSEQEKCSLIKGCGGGARCSDGVCTFSNTYETCAPQNPTEPCTISGKLFDDTVHFGATQGVTANFGAIDFQTSNFEQFKNIDGVIGMAGPRNTKTSVIGQLVETGAVSEDVWGLCLHQGNSNGTITIGGLDMTLATGAMQYTPDVGEPQFYEMKMEGIAFGATKSIAGVKSSIIIDTGTNILLLPDEGYNGLRTAMESECARTHLVGVCNVTGPKSSLFDGACYDMTDAELGAFPDLTLNIDGVSLPMPPRNFLLQGYAPHATPTQFCLGVAKTSPGGLQILGDTTLSLYYTAFDRANKRIGWAPVNTSTCGQTPL